METNNFIETRDVLGGEEGRIDIDIKTWRIVSSELSEYLGRDIKTISREFWGNKERFNKLEELAIENNTTEQEIQFYYKNTKKYLYECTCWEAYRSKQRDFRKIFLLLRKFNINNVLDFGGGTGGLVKYLVKRGIQCDYLDLVGETFNFAKWRFKRNALSVKMMDDLKECSANFYRAVVSDNVFEHLFNLEDIVVEINHVLQMGGILVARSTFGGGGVHLRKNDRYSQFEVYDRFIVDRGFEYMGQLKDDFFTREINKYIKNSWILGVFLKKRRKYGGNFLIHRKVCNVEG